MAIEIVDFPVTNCDFPVRYVAVLPEGTGNVQCSLSVDGQCSFSRPRR